jgi:hypothetical protein
MFCDGRRLKTFTAADMPWLHRKFDGAAGLQIEALVKRGHFDCVLPSRDANVCDDIKRLAKRTVFHSTQRAAASPLFLG